MSDNAGRRLYSGGANGKSRAPAQRGKGTRFLSGRSAEENTVGILTGRTLAAEAKDAERPPSFCTSGDRLCFRRCGAGTLPRREPPYLRPRSRKKQKETAMGQMYQKVMSFDSLYKAYRLARRGKGGNGSAIGFGLDLGKNLWQIHDQLERGTYKPGGYYHFTIFEPKRREIYALRFKDRVVQHSICDNALRDWMEPRLIYDCAACRIGKGTHFAMDRLDGFMQDFYRRHGTKGYVLKCDIRKFFESIDHAVLRERLRKFPDKELLNLMLSFLDAYSGDRGVGIPLGNQSSQWFALYYLDPVDRLIKEKLRIKYYTRYMDDFILIHEDKAYLRHCLKEIKKTAAELKLELNEKTGIFPLSQGVDYLGFHFYLTDTGKVVRKLRTSNKKRYKRRLRALRKKYADGEIGAEDIRQSLASYRGHLEHGNTYHLRKTTMSHFVLRRKEMTYERTDDEDPNA